MNIKALRITLLFNDDHKRDIIKHLQSMNEDDRTKRFGYAISDAAIQQYVDSSWIILSTWHGIYHLGNLIAANHISILKDVAEFGCSVSSMYRGYGLGSKMFETGLRIAYFYSVKEVIVMCSPSNTAIINLAKRHKMKLRSSQGEMIGSINIEEKTF